MAYGTRSGWGGPMAVPVLPFSGGCLGGYRPRHGRVSGITDGPRDPEAQLRRLYLSGEIDVFEFEDRLDDFYGLRGER